MIWWQAISYVGNLFANKHVKQLQEYAREFISFLSAKRDWSNLGAVCKHYLVVNVYFSSCKFLLVVGEVLDIYLCK